MVRKVNRKWFAILFFGSYAVFLIVDRLFREHIWTGGVSNIEKDIATTKYLLLPWGILVLLLTAGRLSDAGISRKAFLKLLIPFYNLYFLISLFFIPSEGQRGSG